MMRIRMFVLFLLVATFLLPLFAIPAANSQSTGTTTTMTMSQAAAQGQCTILTIPFEATGGQLIKGTYGSDVSVNFYILAQSDLGQIQNCRLNPSVRPLYVDENSVGHGNPYDSLPFPASGTYDFVFVYVRGTTELASGYATVELSYPSSITIIATTSSASVPITSTVTSVPSTTTTALSTTSSTTSVQLSSSIVPVTSQAILPTQSASVATSSAPTSIPPSSLSSSGQIPLTTLMAVVGIAVVVVIGLLFATMFRNKKRHTLSSTLAKIDSTYNEFAVDREECRTRLEKIKTDVIEMLNKHQIDEGHFLMLDEKISEYQKQLEQATPKYKRTPPSKDGESASEVASTQAADQTKYCRNCGAKLAIDEKVCKKCGTTQ